jgi:small subunit ribosomal protein S3
MGQKVRPTGFRTGIMVDWVSSWYANKADFAGLLLEDKKIRDFIKLKFKRKGISKVKIERSREKVVVQIYSAKIGMIIGKKGESIERLTADLENMTRRKIEVKTFEVPRPETDPQIVSEDIAEQLEKRASFRRTLKRAIELAMENGAKGCKVQLSGRLGGSEMARQETNMQGSIPLSTLRAKVEYGFSEAQTAQGRIGIKVWINNGDYLNKEEPVDLPPRPDGRRGGRGGRDRRGPRLG